MRALLDVNVLLAVFDEAHVHHDLARDWLLEHGDDGWASCPITENGFVRVLSQPAYPGAVSVTTAIELLVSARQSSAHQFWPADLSLTDVVEPQRIHGPKQLTDLYLLALAAHHGGRLVTFDRAIPRSAVPAAQSHHLHVLGAAR